MIDPVIDWDSVDIGASLLKATLLIEDDYLLLSCWQMVVDTRLTADLRLMARNVCRHHPEYIVYKNKES